MLACFDTHYLPDRTRTACVLFDKWTDASAQQEHVQELPWMAIDYIPGEFYRRELPSILTLLAHLDIPINGILIDGYVWLDNQQRKGLGAHVFHAQDGRCPVIGIAKNRFWGSHAIEIKRGQSKKPIFITATGIASADAAHHIQHMAGEYRIPTLLKQADFLCRNSPATIPPQG